MQIWPKLKVSYRPQTRSQLWPNEHSIEPEQRVNMKSIIFLLKSKNSRYCPSVRDEHCANSCCYLLHRESGKAERVNQGMRIWYVCVGRRSLSSRTIHCSNKHMQTQHKHTFTLSGLQTIFVWWTAVCWKLRSTTMYIFVWV